jgi:excinuclease ABC subunit C
MSLTHKVFGIRSCNEVITGMRQRPCLEYDIKRCLAPCVATICTEERYSIAVADTKLFLEGRNQELAEQLRGRMLDASSTSDSKKRRSCATPCGRSKAVRERQQKMASVELGDRDVLGVKVGASGAVVQVFIVRGRACHRACRVRLGRRGERRIRERRHRGAIQQFYSDHEPPPEIHVPWPPPDQPLLETGSGNRRTAEVRIVMPQRGTKKA